MKKRVIALVLCALMLLSFAACGDKKDNTDTEQTKAELTSAKDEAESKKEEPQKQETNNVFGDFTSTDINGKKVTADIFKDKKVTMVNIWGTFCAPCIGEMPDLQKLSEDYANKDFQIVGIVCDVYNEEKIEVAKDILKETGVAYLNVLPSESLDEAKLNSVISIPETIFIDENGNQIGSNFVGSKSYEDWAKIIDSVLAQVK